MNKGLRVHTNINEDTVLNVNLQQDFDFLEVLSLKINQEDLYKFDKANYGVIVGRVLANDAFGIPNAKISIFIPIEEDDLYRTEITNVYQFSTVRDLNNDNVRYNVLPDFKDDECYRTVGTFPNKRLVLDDNTVLEVFDKYYKYTTVTNNSGDYMLYGIPTGNTTLHVDVDLSDIGVLSQKPRDFYYKGYNETLFDNSNQFKGDGNLDNLTQIITQNHGVLVYPFFGDEEDEEVAITRCDVQIQYKFEPTCVFFGSLITDTYHTNISHDCDPNEKLGENKSLITGQGTIEMIRKTIDGLTEEYQIQGNKLIDGDGVWCYQIPMNLDYVGTDEFGNIVATDNPNKGIPTRCRARFRFTVEESESDYVSRHRAKYLVPNNPRIDFSKSNPTLLNDNGSTLDKHYNFGSSTIDDDYRDMFWNCIYTVKNYIPRLQNTASVETLNYTGLKATNYANNLNPLPFNKARFRLRYSYKILCIIMTIVITIIEFINILISGLDAICLPWPIKKCLFTFSCITFNNGLSEDSTVNVVYAPGCKGKTAQKETRCPLEGKPKCKVEPSFDVLKDKIEQLLSQEYENVRLDFYNDWLNGCLYFPLWFWKRTKKKKYFFGLFKKNAYNSYCQCDKEWNSLSIIDTCTVGFNVKKFNGTTWHKRSETKNTIWGVIKDVVNKDNLSLYYYACGVIPNKNIKDKKDFIRLFATDLVLLGSFNDCDLNGYPKPYLNLPPTTANIPPIAPIKQVDYDSDDESNAGETTITKMSGMDWEHDPDKSGYSKGLVMGIDCSEITTITKTCINLNRLSELGVSADITYQDWFRNGDNLKRKQIINDGFITKTEIDDEETRLMFATLNHNGLDKMIFDKSTGYKVYDLQYVCPTNFDGRQYSSITKKYSNNKTVDNSDAEYMLYRFGSNNPIYYSDTTNYSKDTQNEFYLYNNSFYFYFGLNLGKSAIERFNSMFNATCYQNTKYPFTIGIDKVAAAYALKDCNASGVYNCGDKPSIKKYGVIDVTLNDIKKPFSYTLSYADGGEILSENGLNLKKLVFGVNFDVTAQKYSTTEPTGEVVTYEDTEGVTYYRNGEFRPFLVEKTSNPKITNGNYVITITDSNGKSITETITLVQPNISLNSESVNLGTKFVPKQEDTAEENTYSKPTDIYCSSLGGYVIISSVVIDGDEYEITDVGNLTSSTPTDETDLIVHNVATDTYNKVHIAFSIEGFNFGTDLRSENWKSFIKDVCNNGSVQCGSETIKTITFESGILMLNVWIPGLYNITLTQYDCNGNTVALNDNESTLLFTISNGKQFETFLNNVPTNFINLTNTNRVVTNVNDVTEYFLNVNKETNFYNFPNVATNKSIWESYITYDTEEKDGKYYASNVTKLNALIYKFQCLFNLSNSVFFTGENNGFTMTTNGGTKPIVQCAYPSYDDMANIEVYFTEDGEIEKDSTIYRFWDADAYGAVNCDDSHPSIVSSNYKVYTTNYNSIKGNKTPYVSILGGDRNYGFNPIIVNNDWNYGDNGYGLYFAAYTNNGGVGDYKTMVVQSYPGNAKPLTLDENTLASYSKQDFSVVVENNTNTLKNWFKTYFIDKRISYVGEIFTTSNVPTIESAENLNGRVYFKSMNGIQMAYDKDYNVIGFESDNLEYIVKKEDYTGSSLTSDAKTYYNTNDTVRKLFYTSNMLLDFKQYDLRYAWYNGNIDDSVWMKGKYLPTGPNGTISATTYVENEPYIVGETITTATTEYPFIQYLDLRNVKIESNFSLNLASCSYDMMIDTVDDGDSSESEDVRINATTQSVDLNEITLGCGNFISVDASSNQDYLKMGYFNILCNTTYNTTSKELTVTPMFGRLSFKLGRDYYASDFYYTTFVPQIKTFNNDNDLLATLTSLKTNTTLGDTYNLFGGTKATMYDAITSDTSINDTIGIDDKYFIVKDTNTILQQNGQDDTTASKITLKFDNNSTQTISTNTVWNNETSAYRKNEGLNLSNCDYIMLFTGREYVPTNTEEKLEKVVRVFDCNNVYAVKPFTVSNISTVGGSDGKTFTLKLTIQGQNLSATANAFCNISHKPTLDGSYTYLTTECSSTTAKTDDGIILTLNVKASENITNVGDYHFDISFINDKSLIVGFTVQLSFNNNIEIRKIQGVSVVS